MWFYPTHITPNSVVSAWSFLLWLLGLWLQGPTVRKVGRRDQGKPLADTSDFSHHLCLQLMAGALLTSGGAKEVATCLRMALVKGSGYVCFSWPLQPCQFSPTPLLVNSLPTQSFFSATHRHTDLKSWHPQSQKSHLATGTPELGGGDGSAGEG